MAAKQKYQTKMAEKILAQQKAAGFNKDKVKSWIGGGRILIPVLVPLAYRAITGLQQRNLDGNVGKKFGVTSGDAARFQGYGARLRARIEATRESLKALDKSNAPAAKGFIKDANSRLRSSGGGSGFGGEDDSGSASPRPPVDDCRVRWPRPPDHH